MRQVAHRYSDFETLHKDGGQPGRPYFQEAQHEVNVRGAGAMRVPEKIYRKANCLVSKTIGFQHDSRRFAIFLKPVMQKESTPQLGFG